MHKGSGQALATLDGHDIYLGKHDSPESHARYEQVLAEWLVNHRQSRPAAGQKASPPTGLTVDELLLAYWKHAEQYYVKNGEPTGELANIKDAMKLVAQLYGIQPVTHFGPLALKTVRQAMIDSDLCRKVINARINHVRRVFKWGVENQLVDATLLHALRCVAPLEVAAMIEIQRYTGMRPNEVTAR